MMRMRRPASRPMRAASRTACLAASLFIGLAGLALPAAAQSAASGQALVYDPQPPPGSAFLRFVNAAGAEVLVRSDFLPPQRLGTEAAQRVASYAVVEHVAGRNLMLEASTPRGSTQVTLQAAPGSFVTLILSGAADGGLVATPLVDHTEFNQVRARLSFYNATSGCGPASLRLRQGGAVFTDVAPGTAKTRSVTPVSAQLVAECGGRPATTFALEGLEPGGTYSVWLMQPDGQQPIAFFGRDTTARWQR